MFKESFEGVSRKFEGYFKKVSKMFQGRLKGVSRQFQRLSKVSGVLKVSVKCVFRNLKKKCEGCFKNVSMKFCFAILFLYGSHRSYPSRQKECCFNSDASLSYHCYHWLAFLNIDKKLF